MTGIRYWLLTGVLLWTACEAPALALDIQSPGIRGNPGAARKELPTKLTAEECTGDGGVTRADGNCVSGLACYRADELHVVHVLCINKK